MNRVWKNACLFWSKPLSREKFTAFKVWSKTNMHNNDLTCFAKINGKYKHLLFQVKTRPHSDLRQINTRCKMMTKTQLFFLILEVVGLKKEARKTLKEVMDHPWRRERWSTKRNSVIWEIPAWIALWIKIWEDHNLKMLRAKTHKWKCLIRILTEKMKVHIVPYQTTPCQTSMGSLKSRNWRRNVPTRWVDNISEFNFPHLFLLCL